MCDEHGLQQFLDFLTIEADDAWFYIGHAACFYRLFPPQGAPTYLPHLCDFHVPPNNQANVAATNLLIVSLLNSKEKQKNAIRFVLRFQTFEKNVIPR